MMVGLGRFADMQVSVWYHPIHYPRIGLQSPGRNDKQKYDISLALQCRWGDTLCIIAEFNISAHREQNQAGTVFSTGLCLLKLTFDVSYRKMSYRCRWDVSRASFYSFLLVSGVVSNIVCRDSDILAAV